jgi:thiol-disulfide isomerase/thioredoxin
MLAPAALLFACAHHPDRVDALEAAVAAQQSEIAAQEAEIRDLQTRVAALEQEGGAGTGATAATAPGKPSPEAEQAASAAIAEATARIDTDPIGARDALAALIATYPGTRAAKAAERLLPELQVVGQKAPPLDVDWWFGAEGHVGRVTVLVFAEEWCPHCRHELPLLEGTYERLHPEGLDVVVLTQLTKSATKDNMKAFIAENHLTYPVGHEGGATSEAFAVTGIPAAAVIKDGVVVWRGHPAKLTDEQLRGWLKP